MSTVFDIADRYVTAMAALSPVSATSWGVPGHEHELGDFSPAGNAARAELQRATLAALTNAPTVATQDRVAANMIGERLGVQLSIDETGERLRQLRVIASPQGKIREAFDLMTLTDEADWEHAAARLAAVPAALAGCQETLETGVASGQVAARRQALACADQYDAFGGVGGRSFFEGFIEGYDGTNLARALSQGAADAAAAYRAHAAWLRTVYAPAADTRDPVGRDRYALAARVHTGAELDLDETYAWGWDELARIEARMAIVAHRIVAGASVDEVIAHVEADPAYVIDGEAEFLRWNQDLIDTTVADLNGTHFDIAAPIQRCEAMIAPPGGAAAMYYTGPSEDLSRPGRTWYPTQGRTRFPLWREVSICYHEGVPGHHLQIAQAALQAETLSRFQRVDGFVPGHGEGWALYAERLMDELGYLDDPVFELGMLSCQAMRAVRVIVDIGMHLGLRIPTSNRFEPGEVLTAERALPFVLERSRFPEAFMRSEVDRYLGWPGQAITYKVGERVWLAARDEAKARHGAEFDLRAFHRHALDLGGMGLDQLRAELADF